MSVVVMGIIVAADAGLPLPFRRILALPLADKLGHFLLIGGLNWLVVQAAMAARPDSRTRVTVLSSLALLALAAIEEWSQRYFPSRTLSFWDFAASGLGIVTAAAMSALGSVASEPRARACPTGRRV